MSILGLPIAMPDPSESRWSILARAAGIVRAAGRSDRWAEFYAEASRAPSRDRFAEVVRRWFDVESDPLA